MSTDIAAFFDPATFTVSYLVSDPATSVCAIIDPVLDYDQNLCRTSSNSVQRIIDHMRARNLRLELILETHAHADHVSAATYLRSTFNARVGIGARIVDTQKIFARLFNLKDFTPDGSQFDILLRDGDTLPIGNLACRVMETPGHTPGCVTFLIGDAAFVGDTLFMPDYGTARADFPGGDARTLYRSIQKILALPDTTRIFTGHDYPPPGRSTPAWESTVAKQRANVHLGLGGEDAFVSLRTERDKTLDKARLLVPAIQMNIRAGAPPAAEENGKTYLKFPLNVF